MRSNVLGRCRSYAFCLFGLCCLGGGACKSTVVRPTVDHEIDASNETIKALESLPPEKQTPEIKQAIKVLRSDVVAMKELNSYAVIVEQEKETAEKKAESNAQAANHWHTLLWAFGIAAVAVGVFTAKKFLL